MKKEEGNDPENSLGALLNKLMAKNEFKGSTIEYNGNIYRELYPDPRFPQMRIQPGASVFLFNGAASKETYKYFGFDYEGEPNIQETKPCLITISLQTVTGEMHEKAVEIQDTYEKLGFTLEEGPTIVISPGNELHQNGNAPEDTQLHGKVRLRRSRTGRPRVISILCPSLLKSVYLHLPRDAHYPVWIYDNRVMMGTNPVGMPEFNPVPFALKDLVGDHDKVFEDYEKHLEEFERSKTDSEDFVDKGDDDSEQSEVENKTNYFIKIAKNGRISFRNDMFSRTRSGRGKTVRCARILQNEEDPFDLIISLELEERFSTRAIYKDKSVWSVPFADTLSQCFTLSGDEGFYPAEYDGDNCRIHVRLKENSGIS